MTATNWRVECGDTRAVLADLPERCAQSCVTSPPAWRDKDDHAPPLVSPDLYVAHVVEVMQAVRRVLRDDGTLWLGLRDTLAPACADLESHSLSPPRLARDSGAAAGLRRPGPRDLAGVPWRVALALQADGWRLRADVAWIGPDAVPERAHDRPHRVRDYVFLLTKQSRYLYCDPDTSTPSRRPSRRGATHDLRGSGRCRCSTVGMGAQGSAVWCAPTRGCSHARRAALSERLAERCVLAATTARCCGICGAPWPKRRTPTRPACSHLNATGRCLVLDPFCGSGTVGVAACRHGRAFLGIDPCARSVQRARQRITHAVTSHPSEAAR